MSRDRWVILSLVVMCAGLRSIGLIEPSMWYDEAFSRTLAYEFSMQEMFGALRSDVHPPLYFLLLRAWCVLLGDGIAVVRALSVSMSCVTAVGVFLLTREIVRRQPTEPQDTPQTRERYHTIIAAAAGMFYIVGTPFVVESQQAKSYALGTALCVFSSWCLLRLLPPGRQPNWPRILAYGVTAGAFTLTHPYGLFTVTAQIIYLGGTTVKSWWTRPAEERAAWATPVAAGVVVLAMYALWLPVVLEQTARVQRNYWIGEFTSMTIPNSLLLLLYPSSSYGELEPGRSILMILLILASLVVMFRQNRLQVGVLLALIWLPLLFTAGVSTFVASVCTPRYLLFVAVFFPVLAVLAIEHILPRFVFVAVVMLCIINQFVYTLGYQSSLEYAKRQGSRALVQELVGTNADQAPVIVRHPAVFSTVKYYGEGRFRPRLLGDLEDIPHYIGRPILREEDMISPAELSRLDAETVWIVDTTGFAMIGSPPVPRPWHNVPNSAIAHEEVHPWQGWTSAELYRRD